MSDRKVKVEIKSVEELWRLWIEERHWADGMGSASRSSARRGSSSSIVSESGGMENGDTKGWARARRERVWCDRFVVSAV